MPRVNVYVKGQKTVENPYFWGHLSAIKSGIHCIYGEKRGIHGEIHGTSLGDDRFFTKELNLMREIRHVRTRSLRTLRTASTTNHDRLHPRKFFFWKIPHMYAVGISVSGRRMDWHFKIRGGSVPLTSEIWVCERQLNATASERFLTEISGYFMTLKRELEFH